MGREFVPMKMPEPRQHRVASPKPEAGPPVFRVAAKAAGSAAARGDLYTADVMAMRSLRCRG